MGRTGGVEPDVKRSSGFGRLAWGAAIALSTIFGVLAGPKILRDQHELMCGWSSGWQDFAGAFGDCSSYAQKSVPTVVINGPVVPQGPVANKVIYDQTYPVFVAALGETDVGTLKQLLQSDFRLKNAHVCAALENYMPDATKDAPTIVGLLSQFASDGVKCKTFSMDRELTPDAFLLALGFDDATSTCNSNYSSERWAKTVALIDGWIAAKGQSKELAQVVSEKSELLHRGARSALAECVDAGLYEPALLRWAK